MMTTTPMTYEQYIAAEDAIDATYHAACNQASAQSMLAADRAERETDPVRREKMVDVATHQLIITEQHADTVRWEAKRALDARYDRLNRR